MAVLAYLAERHGETVSREDLLDEVWKTRFVVEEALTRCISQIRQLLDDDTRNPRFVRTVPKLGYRLLVAPEPVEPSAAVAYTRGTRVSIVWTGLAALVVLGLIAAFWLRNSLGTTDVHQPSVAILPFMSMSSDPADALFADGMTEEVIQLLSRIPSFRVPSRTSSFHFKGQRPDVGTVGEQLGVANVLEGSIRRDGERMRITVQLIDVSNDAHIWSEVYDRKLQDLFEVQQEIATAIAQKLSVALRPGLLSGRAPTQDMAAYQLYLEARMRPLTEMRAAIELYESAVQRDPQFSAAWAHLGLAYWMLPGYEDVSPQEIPNLDAEAKAAAERALALDDSVGPAHIVLADYDHTYRRSSAAEARYQRALANFPGDAQLHAGYAAMLGEVGRLDESLRHRQLFWTLEPLSAAAAFHLARIYAVSGRHDDARRLAERTRALSFKGASLDNPEAYLHVHARELDAAKAIWTHSAEADEAKAMTLVLRALEDPQAREDARSAIQTLPPWHALPFRGRVFAACLLGDAEAAFQAASEGVERGLDATDNWWIPECAPLRTHARFAELAAGMNLTDYWRKYGWPNGCNAKGTSFECD